MRIVFIGAGPLTVATARLLIGRQHDVVIVDADKERLDALAEDLDCGLIHGDGTKPALLREVGPSQVDYLYCLTDSDRDNILAGLVGRSLGFPLVVVKITDPELENICVELGLEHTIVPDRTIARTLSDTVEGQNSPELSTMIKGELRFFAFIARDEDEGPIGELDLPSQTQVVAVYRGNEFFVGAAEPKLQRNDYVLLVTHRKHLSGLRERWGETSGTA